MKKRILSLLMVLSMIITMLPAGTLTAFAADVPSDEINEEAEATSKTTEPVPAQTTPEIVIIQYVPDVDLPDNDELFAGYAEQMFSPWGGVSFFGTAAGARLTGDEKAVYDALVPIIKDIADGKRASTHIGLGQTLENVKIDAEGNTATFTADKPVTFTGNTFSDDSLHAVVSALLADFPYEMYWYDKVTGVQMGSIKGKSTLSHLYFEFTVAPQYRANATDIYTADTAKTGAAKTAAANAAAIVAKYEKSSDYEKLVGYKTEICNLVSYDHDAADNDNYFTTTNSDPWQLIYVFDGDTDTNVVCEGYAKAFQYLCDLGDLDCICVSGTMSGGTGAGPHMWNVVTLGGNNYLVDVTNCDYGTVGAHDKLFMVGGTYDVNGYSYAIGNQTITYTCDNLSLAASDYTTYTVTVSANPEAGGSVSGGGTVGAGASVTLTATATTGYTFVNWTENGTEVSTNATYTFTAEADCTLVANFEKLTEAKWGADEENLNNSGTLAEAIAEATAADSTVKYVQLQSDVLLESYIEIKNGEFTIDLNGKRWKSNENVLDISGTTTNITIVDSAPSGGGTLITEASGYPAINLYGSAKLTVAGGTISGLSNAVDMSYNGSTTTAELTVTGGTLKTTSQTRAISAYGNKVTITGGEITSGDDNIYWANGGIDLSDHKNPAGISFYFYNDNASMNDIKLPKDYCICKYNDTSGNPVTSLVSGKSYKIAEFTCNHTNYTNGFCEVCDAYEPATDSNGVYQIANAGQLYWFAALVNGDTTATGGVAQNKSANAVLTDNITVNSDVLTADGKLATDTTGFRTWTPIGNYYNQYTGTFDGNGKTVSGLYFNDSTATYVGLFGYVGMYGKVQNVGVVDSYFSGMKYVGGVVGCNYGRLTNCYNTGVVTGSDYYVGGVLGQNNSGGSVTNCYNTGVVSGRSSVGGVVGSKTADSTVTNCYYLANSDDGNGGKTAEQFKSGEVAYLLQGEQTEQVWGQEIGTDDYPVLGGDKVYCSYDSCADNAEKSYTNDSTASTTKPEHNWVNGVCQNNCGTTHAPHSYENGFCTVCDAYQPAVQISESNREELGFTDGTYDGYYAIANAGQLYWFAALVIDGETSANAVLTANITVNTGVLKADGTLNEGNFRDWTPIRYNYVGTFDGGGHTVSGLYFNNSNGGSVGLFSSVGTNGKVQNVGVVDSYFRGGANVGGVVGDNNGTVKDCHNTGTVTGSSYYVGGVVGLNRITATVENCYNEGSVTGNRDYVGGVVGFSWEGAVVKGSYNEGSVRGSGDYVGGVVGENTGAVTACYNTGDVTGSGNCVGGVVGSSSQTVASVTNSYNTGIVTGSGNFVGGVVGINNGSTVTAENCYYLDTCGAGDEYGTSMTAAQFASGEVAYKLQSGVAEVDGAVPEIWGQNLDNDKTPDASPNFTGAKVYQIENTGCKVGGEYGYSNDESTVYAPEHTGNFSYTPNEGGTTHKKAYDCCGVVADEAEAHDFTNGKCVCGEKPTPVVTVTAAAGLSYTGAAQELLTGSTTGGTIWYKLDDGTYSTTIPTATDAGTYTVYYKVVGDENYKDVAEQSIEVSIAPKTVTITGATIEDVLFNENGGYALKVTAVTFNGVVEGENLDYTASAVLTGNNAVANGVAATVTVTLSNSNYSLQATTFAGSVNIIEHKHVWNYEANGSIITAICSGDIGVCSVTNKTVTIKLVAPTNLTYDGTAKAVTVEQSPAGVFTDLPVVEYTGDRQNVSVDGFTASITIDNATAEAEFTIEKATPTIAWDSTTASVKYTGSMATITAPTVTLVNNESFSGTISYSYTGTSSGSGLPTNAGTYTITANIDAQGNYTAATSTNTLTLTITKAAAPAIVWPTASDLVYGQKLSASTLTSTDSNGTFAWQNGEAVPTVTNSGYVVIYTPNNTANYDYSGVELTKTISVTVGKAAATVTTAPTAKALTYTGEAQALVNAGTTSDGTLVYSLTEDGQYTETIPTGTNAEEYTVWYYVVGDANHSDSSKASVKVTIAKAKAAIDVDTSTITVTYGETVNLPIATSNFGTVSCDTTADKLVNAGTYTVTYSVAAADNWEGDTKTLQVVVEQLAVVEPTVNGTYTYTGEEQTVALTGVESYMTVASGDKGTNADTYEVEITLNPNYKWADDSDGKLQWSIAKAQAEITVDTTPIEKTYGDTWTLPEAATNFGTVSADKTVADMVNAGTYTVTYTVEGTDNYNGAEKTITVTVSPKVVTAAVTVVGENFIFNGSEQKPSITVKDGENTIPESEYTATYTNNTNAGTATVTVTDNVGGNYTVSGETTFVIAKKASAALSGVECEFTRLTATTGNEIDVEAMLPDDHGTATYTITSSGYTVLENVSVDANGKLVFDTKTSETAASDTITVMVEMQNYTNVTLTVSVRLSEKAPQKITGVSAATGLIYNGEAQQGYTGTPTSDFTGAYEITYTGRDNAYNSSTAPTNAGDYTVTFKIPDSDLYYSGNVSVNFTIGKAQATVTAGNKEVYVGSRMPELTYKVSGLIGDDTISVELSCDANMNRTGEYPIVVTAADPNGNYEITTVNGTLTVKYYPISSPIITPTYSPVVDGGNNGDVTVSPKNPAKGDTVTITPDPDKGYEVDEVIVTDKNGKPVTVIGNGDGTYSFKQPNGKANIEVTFTEITEADETEKIETTENICTLDNTCPMHRYDDLDMTAWYHEGVHFCLENGLMNGTGADTFAPDMTTSRAMIVTILWRLEGEPVVNYAMDFDDVAADTWYTEAIRWAASEGIVNGYSDTAFGPNDAITREQLATILYRYEQYNDGGFNGLWMIRMDYVDLADVSDWAYEAMCWMNMNGIVNGKPGKILDPKGSATRAESATMLYRYCEVMTKENDN